MDLSSTYSWRHSTMRAHGTKAVARHCLHGVAGGPSMTRGTTGPPVMDGGSSTLVGRGHGWGSSYSGAPGSSRARPGCPSPTDKHRGALPPTARCGRAQEAVGEDLCHEELVHWGVIPSVEPLHYSNHRKELPHHVDAPLRLR
jgi:hypothetical protein